MAADRKIDIERDRGASGAACAGAAGRPTGTADDDCARSRVFAAAPPSFALGAIANLVAEGVAIVGPTGRIISANQSFATLAGCPAAGLAGTPLNQFIPLETIAALSSADDGMKRDVNLRRADGREVACQVSAAVAESDGQRVHCLVFRELADELLRVRHKAILDSTADAVMAFDVDGRITSWNRAAEVLFGYTAAEAIGRDADLLVKPLDHVPPGETARGAFDIALSGRKFRGDTWRVAKDGTVIDVSVTATRIVAPDGRVLGVSGILRDTRGRKRAEQAIRNSEAKFRAIADYTYDWESWVGPDGNLIWVSPAVERLTGHTVAECLAMQDYPLPFIHPDDRERMARSFRDALAGIAGNDVPFRILHRSGREIWGSASWQPLADQGYRSSIRDISERKKAEDQLRFGEARFRLMADHSPGMVWVAGPDGGVTYMARSWYELSGQEEGGAIGEGWAEAVHPDDRERVLTLDRNAVAARASYTAEYRLSCRTGGWRWLLDRAQTYWSPSGEFLGWIGSAMDITEHKRIEEALRESDERLRVALEAGAVGTWHVDFGTMTEQRDQSLNRILGLGSIETSECVDDFLARVHPEDRDAFKETFCRALDGDGAYDTEIRIVLPDGRIRWLRDRGRIVRDDAGQPIYATGAAADITPSKTAEQALRDSEARYRMLHESLRDAFVQVDMDGRIVDCNELYCQLLGYSRDELGSKTYIDLTPVGWHEFEAEIVRTQILPRGYSDVYQKEYRRKDGTIIPIELRSFVLRGANGEPRAMWATVRDISERKKAEEAARCNARLDAFRVEISDALRPLSEPAAVQREAARVLAQWLNASRVAYFEIRGPDYVVENGYAQGVSNLSGAYPSRSFGERLFETFMSGATAVSRDVQRDTSLTLDERAAYGAIDVAAYIGVPLLKGERLVAGLAVHSREPRSWSEDDIALAEETAERTWAAVVRARSEQDLRAAHATFRHLVQHSPFGIYAVDADFRVIEVSDGARKVFRNVSPLIGRDLGEVLHTLWEEPFASEAIGHFRRTLATGAPYHALRTVERRKDRGEIESYDWQIERVVMPDGRFGTVCHFYDLSERQRYEDQIRLLMREVNHRSKNLLAVVQSVVAMTAGNTAPEQFVGSLTERLMALAAAQDLIVRGDWCSVPLIELIRSQLGHLGGVESRVRLDGEHCVISPAAAQGIGMALHELATNALKHGALSSPEGHVEIRWWRDDGAAGRRFLLTWRERGGPAVEEPARRGFGRTVIERMAAYAVRGEVNLRFEPSGLVWTLKAPELFIFHGEAPQPSRSTVEGSETP